MSEVTRKAANRAARDAIFGKLRASLAATPGDGRDALVDARIAARARSPIPERARLDAAAARTQFKGFLERGHATVVDVATLEAVPQAIASYLRDRNRPLRIRMGADPRLSALPWATAPTVERTTGAAHPDDEVSLSYALAAAAETGTLVLASGPDNPVTLNYLPETHLVLLDAANLTGGYEAAFDIVRDKFGVGVMPRTINLISGPSRTSDIGGKTVMGAHGPRHLAVFMVG
jgi:L-lactate dehydrogenase complex protein LldG